MKFTKQYMGNINECHFQETEFWRGITNTEMSSPDARLPSVFSQNPSLLTPRATSTRVLAILVGAISVAGPRLRACC